MKLETKIPHSLRLAIFFLRVILGLNLFALGFSRVFKSSIASGFIGVDSFSNLRYLMASSLSASTASAFVSWSLIIIGACLTIGLMTRFMSLFGMVLTVLSYLTGFNLIKLTMSQLINDQVVAFICLFIFILTRAGEYVGLDKFVHLSFRKNRV